MAVVLIRFLAAGYRWKLPHMERKIECGKRGIAVLTGDSGHGANHRAFLKGYIQEETGITCSENTAVTVRFQRGGGADLPDQRIKKCRLRDDLFPLKSLYTDIIRRNKKL